MRLLSGRIVGPFYKEQLGELLLKGHLKGEEFCQIFPNGEWGKIESFDEVNTLFLKILANEIHLEELQAKKESLHSKLKKLRKDDETSSLNAEKGFLGQGEGERKIQLKVSESFREFNYKKMTNDLGETDSLTIHNSNNDQGDNEDISQIEGQRNSLKKDGDQGNENTDDDNENDKIALDSYDDDLEATRVVSKQNIIVKGAVEKTRIINIEGLKSSLNKEKKNANDKKDKSITSDSLLLQNLIKKSEVPQENENLPIKKEDEQKSNKGPLEEEELDADAETRVFKVDEAFKKGKVRSIVRKFVEEEKEKKKEKLFEATKVTKVLKEAVDIKKIKEKKPMKPIVAFAFIVIFYFALIDDEGEENLIRPIRPQIIYPVSYEKPSEDKARAYYRKGIDLYERYDYMSKLKSSEAFVKSLQNDRDLKALGYLVLVYAELLDNIIIFTEKYSEKVRLGNFLIREKAANTIFKLILEGQSKSLTDIRLVMGTAIFFSKLKKYDAALDVLEKFKLIKTNKPTLKYYSIFLKTLVLAEKFSLAQKLYDKLIEVKNKSFDVYSALAAFAFATNNFKDAEELLFQAHKKYPKSVAIMLEYAKVVIHNNEFRKLALILVAVKKLKAENSGDFYAKYLEYKGILFAFKDKKELATKFFRMSLQVKESISLRSKLAALKLGGGSEVIKIVRESKQIETLRKARVAMEKKKWKEAFSYAIEAKDRNPADVEAKLLLAQMQTQRGFFTEAIENLAKLWKDFPRNPEITFSLVDAYIKSYKFSDADRMFQNMQSNRRLMQSSEFAGSMARKYWYQSKPIESIRWLKKSVGRNPLNDENLFLLGSIFLQFKKFQQAKIYLTKAIDLGPTKIDYKLKYAELLYELEGADTAIGFLNNLLTDRAALLAVKKSDIPKIEGEVAIYYYKSGQIKQFEYYKEKLEKNYEADANLYRFLVKASKIEDDVEDVIEYSMKLLDLTPDNLQVRMTLGEYLLEHGKTDLALKQFLAVQERLKTYPRLLFFISKIYLLQGNNDKALEYALEEVKNNPHLEHGHLLLGEIYINKKEFKKALENYKNAQQKNPGSIEALMGLAWISFKDNNVENALDLYLKAAALDPNRPELRRQLGHVYKELGQGTLAVEAFKVYLELAPDAKDRGQVEAIIRQLQ